MGLSTQHPLEGLELHLGPLGEREVPRVAAGSLDWLLTDAADGGVIAGHWEASRREKMLGRAGAHRETPALPIAGPGVEPGERRVMSPGWEPSRPARLVLRGLCAPRLTLRRQRGELALRGEAPQADLLTMGLTHRANAAVLVGLATVGLVEIAEPEMPAEDSGGKVNVAHLRNLPG